jgi:hypothetical protein
VIYFIWYAFMCRAGKTEAVTPLLKTSRLVLRQLEKQTSQDNWGGDINKLHSGLSLECLKQGMEPSVESDILHCLGAVVARNSSASGSDRAADEPGRFPVRTQDLTSVIEALNEYDGGGGHLSFFPSADLIQKTFKAVRGVESCQVQPNWSRRIATHGSSSFGKSLKAQTGR